MSTRVSPIVAARKMDLGSGFTARHLDEEWFRGGIDPVLMLDHYRMKGPTFAPHPHAGFSAVSYLFEDSAGSMKNLDTLGSKGAILPGELHWMLAGSGAIHDENPLVSGEEVHGLQIFVNLDAGHKFMPPQAFRLTAVEIPVIEGESVRIRMVLGDLHGVTSRLPLPAPFTLLDIAMERAARYGHALHAEWNAMVYVVKGEVLLFCAGETRRMSAGDAVAVGAGEQADRIELDNVGDQAQLVILAGPPLRQPIVKQGPFVMNSREQIHQVIADYQQGRMGVLATG